MSSKKQKTEVSRLSQLELLPNECCLEICLHLNPSDLGRLCAVSKRFKNLLEEGPNQQINGWKALCSKWGIHELTLRGITETSWKSMLLKVSKIKQPSVICTFNVLICGDTFVGKRSLVKKIAYNPSDMSKDPDSIALLDLETNLGPVRFNIQTSVQPSSQESSPETAFVGTNVQCAIIMFDVTNRMSYKNSYFWYQAMQAAHGNIPMVLVGNKVDIKDRKVKPKHITLHRKKNFLYYDISVNSNYQVFKPFLYLLRTKLTGDPTLQLISTPPISPPQLELSANVVREIEAALEQTYMVPAVEDEFL